MSPAAGGREIHRYTVTLRDIHPEIWRSIAVPAESSFWDLHVAIQDAMGWHDTHLHAFRFTGPDDREGTLIGIPDDDGFVGDPVYLPGWTIPIKEYFRRPGDRALYEYDFGDGWEHDVVLEEIAPRPARKKFPVCLDGARACPPEDCGGIGGYENLLDAIADPAHPEHEELGEWLREFYGNYDPERFDAKKVRFDDPGDRWRGAFGRPR
jgi:hypothetical protein